MIEVKDLLKRYGAFEAIRDVTFEVERGEVIGFLGPNGAGKTTTMKILTGYLLATAGEAKVAGFSVRTDPLEVRRRIGYLPESAPLYHDMRPLDYLRFCGDVRRLPRARRAARIGEVSARCGLDDVMKVPIGHLSKGYRQRVGLASALLHEPELLILDEPTTGLDPNQIVEIRDLLREIGREKTIILSTHILREVEATCDRVLIISQGRIVADAPPEKLQQSDTLVVRGTGATEREAREAFEGHPAFIEAATVGEPGGASFCLRLRAKGVEDPGAEAFRVAREGGLVLSEIRAENPSLEEVFHQLTNA